MEGLSTQRIFKVGELTKQIRFLLESQFKTIWVEGEISNFKKHSSGHMYFTLKDETAQISAVFFARENQMLKFEPEDGLCVICIGRISVYEARGQYQVYVQRMEPKGLGALQLAFLQLKEKLEKEGLFDVARKRPILKYPRNIGIITSPTGAAIQDMLKIFKKQDYGFHIRIFPARVQGEGSAEEIVAALGALNHMSGLDLIVVGRGGGSLEDLWSFNDERVARAIASSRIPVISAVGHEVDWTIADFVADYRAHTPTAAAERIVMYWDELQNRLRENRERMQNSILILFGQKQEELANIRESYAFRQPVIYLQQFKQRVDDLIKQTNSCFQNLLVRKEQNLNGLIGKLNALSPLAILERGYSLSFNQEGNLLKSVKGLKKGDMIQTRLRTGIIKSEVIKVEE